MRSYLDKDAILKGRHNTGSTVLVAMLLLVIMSLLGVYALDTTRMDVQVAGNEKIHRQTFYAAESAWQVTVSWLDSVYPPITEAMETTNLAKYLSGDPDDDRSWIALEGNSQLEYATDVQFVGASNVVGYSSDFKQYTYTIDTTSKFSDKSEVAVSVGAGKMFYVGGY